MSETTEKLIALSEVPALPWLPRRRAGARLHVATLWRWSERGVAGVRLETVFVGGCRCTTEAMLRTFFDAVTAAKTSGQAAPDSSRRPTRSSSRRQLDHTAARHRLADAGI